MAIYYWQMGSWHNPAPMHARCGPPWLSIHKTMGFNLIQFPFQPARSCRRHKSCYYI